MNTIKKIAIALAVLMVFSLAAPATADYSGDHPLVTYAKGPLNDGGIVYVTDETGDKYTKLPCPVYDNETAPYLTQDITITIPQGKTVKMARLYNYVTWSTCDNDTRYTSGVPAEAVLTFNDVSKTCVHGFSDAQIGLVPNPIDYGNGAIQYWDTKGPDYDCGAKYDYPSGTFAWDVTDIVKPILDVSGSSTFTATITNADSTPTGMRPGKPYHPVNYRERFVTYGFGLLVVYKSPVPPSISVDGKYWIDEGCDLLYNTSLYGVSEPIATTYAPFKEGVGMSNGIDKATFTTVVTASNMGNITDWDKSENIIYLNSLTPNERLGPSTAKDSYSIGVNEFVLEDPCCCWDSAPPEQCSEPPCLNPSQNKVYFQDIDILGLPKPAKDGKGDNEVVSNAFLLVDWA